MVKDDFGFLGQIFENIGLQSSQYERLEYWRYVCRTSNRHIRSLTASQHAVTQQLQGYLTLTLQSSQYERLEYWRYVCRTSNRHIRSLTASQHAATQQLQGYLASKNPPLISQCPNHL